MLCVLIRIAFNIKKKIALNYPKSATMGFFPRNSKTSLKQPLKLYCSEKYYPRIIGKILLLILGALYHVCSCFLGAVRISVSRSKDEGNVKYIINPTRLEQQKCYFHLVLVANSQGDIGEFCTALHKKG